MVILLSYVDSILPSKTVALSELKAFHQCLYSLLSHLMGSQQHSVDIIINQIKLFLSSVHYYEKAIGFPTNASNEKLMPLWYSRSNFVSLLNLPKQIQKYGPLRLYWEGNRERYIQVVKPILVNKRNSVSYLHTKLTKIYKLSTFGNMLANNLDTKNEKQYKRFDDLRVYYNISKLQQKAREYESMAGVIISNQSNHVILILKTGNNYIGYEVIIQVSGMFYKSNLPFFPIVISEQPFIQFQHKEDLINSILDYVMMIPFVQNNSHDDGKGYAFLTKKWTFLNEKLESTIYQPNIQILEKIIENNL